MCTGRRADAFAARNCKVGVIAEPAMRKGTAGSGCKEICYV